MFKYSRIPNAEEFHANKPAFFKHACNNMYAHQQPAATSLPRRRRKNRAYYNHYYVVKNINAYNKKTYILGN